MLINTLSQLHEFQIWMMTEMEFQMNQTVSDSITLLFMPFKVKRGNVMLYFLSYSQLWTLMEMVFLIQKVNYQMSQKLCSKINTSKYIAFFYRFG